MRLLAAIVLACLTACGSLPPDQVRSRDLAWLAGSWTGTTTDGATIEQDWSEPADGAVRGEHRQIEAGQVVVLSEMRMISGIHGVVLLGALDGHDARRYGLVEFRHRFARFRGTSFEYPGEIEFSRTGSTLTVTVRGDVGLRQVHERVYELSARD